MKTIGVKTKTTFVKIICLLLLTAYAMMIAVSISRAVPAKAIESMTKMFFLAASSMLGVSIWKMVLDTTNMDLDQFKKIYYPDYIVTMILFVVIYAAARKTDSQKYETILSWSGSGIGVVIIAIITALKGNALAMSVKEKDSLNAGEKDVEHKD